MLGSVLSIQRVGCESGSEAGTLPEPQLKAEQQPLKDGGSGERGGQGGSVYPVQVKHG